MSMSARVGMMGCSRRAVLAAGAGAGAATVVGCGRDGPRGGGKVDRVTHVTGFNVTGQDAFVFAAIEHGWYREANIEVDVVGGVGTRGNLQRLADGSAQFAVIDLTGGMLELDRGTVAEVRVFAAVYQLNVSCVVALPGSGIAAPRDLAGKRIGFAEGGVNRTIFPAYARRAGLDEGSVRWVSLAPASIRPALIAGQLDAATETVIGRPGVEAAARQPVTMLPYSDVLPDLYGNALTASAAVATSNPGLVRRFRDATLRGLRWTVDNPDEAGRVMARHNPAYQAATAAAEVKQAVAYVRGSAPVLGHLDRARLERSIALMREIGLIKPGLSADRIAAFELAPKA
jgi:NitT/TauT family transport system substrate-binding protein